MMMHNRFAMIIESLFKVINYREFMLSYLAFNESFIHVVWQLNTSSSLRILCLTEFSYDSLSILYIEGRIMSDQKLKDDEYWRAKLTKEEYAICRLKGTERAFTGAYWDTKTAGVYRCRCCGEPLFNSETKYDSGSGWPSFFQAINDSCILEESDHSLGMVRTEIMCKKCGSHLGHVFSDGPKPTGQRYCVNSASIKLNAGE